jgi:hypothetical protein
MASPQPDAGTAPLKMSAEDARELTYGGDFSAEGLTVESDEQTGTSRWESIHLLVVKDRDGRLWAATYRQGLTEYQDSRAFGDDDDREVQFYEVEKVPVTTYEYRRIGAEAGESHDGQPA